jgi:hypothetical protein
MVGYGYKSVLEPLSLSTKGPFAVCLFTVEYLF